MRGPVCNFGDARLPERFWVKVSPCPMSGCWLWTAAETNGYGYYGIRTGVIRRAHRVAFIALVGDVAADLDLDHLCRVRCCVNPAHLEPVTRKVNLDRSPLVNPTRHDAHCKCGAEFTNSPTGRERYCKTCSLARYYEKKAAGIHRRKVRSEPNKPRRARVA